MNPGVLGVTLLAALTVYPVQTLSAQTATDTAAPDQACLPADTEGRGAAGLIAAEDARFAAQVAGNVTKVGEGLADDLAYVHAMGMRQTKAQFLAALADGKARYASITASGRVAQVCGPLGWTRAFYTIVVGDRTLQSSYLAVYTWREGRWQLLSWQTTPAPADEVRSSKSTASPPDE